MRFFESKIKDVLDYFGTTRDGLNNSQVKVRQETYGLNIINSKKQNFLLKILIDQVNDFLVILLFIATIISFILGDIIEAIAMLSMIILTILLGFLQEFKAEKSLQELKKLASITSVVIRNGQEITVDSKLLVPGDIVLLEPGTIVPADLRLIETDSLKIDESSLTGESKSYFKISKASQDPMKNQAFAGTAVVYGTGKGVVIRTGLNTEFGKIAKSLTEFNSTMTPMQKKLKKLGKQLILIVIIISLIIFFGNFIKGTLDIKESLLIALSLAVAAAPTSLPAIVTISLSKGVSRLAKKNMLIKKLPAAEGLGSTTIICSDKTGTLTKNEMSVVKVYSNNKMFDVTGTGYSFKGNVLIKNKPANIEEIHDLITVSLICNDSKLVVDKKTNKVDIIGDPTEAALLVLTKKTHIDESLIRSRFQTIKTLPFDSERKMMSVIVKDTYDSTTKMLTKGAPNNIIKNSKYILLNNKIKPFTKSQKQYILKILKEMESESLRVLGFSFKLLKNKKNSAEKNMVFLGLVGMTDPPRESVENAIEKCRTAGINVMMITGDSLITAKTIAQKIGLLQKNDVLITGDEFDKLSSKALLKKISSIRVCARFMPSQKLRIVEALQKNNNVVAMTGDGVNDAPALKKADLGISMGSGTDLAKEVSDMILLDNNFTTIVNAVEEGRNIYDKMLSSIKYLLTCNSGELLTLFFALLLNLPIPLVPLQILLLNLLTDGLPALALGMGKSDPNVMLRKPRPLNENPITKKMFLLIIIFGIIMSSGSLFLFTKYYKQSLVLGQTIAFTTIVMFEMFAVLSSKKLYTTVISKDFFDNKSLFLSIGVSILIQILVIYVPFLQKVFHTTSLGFIHWIYLLIISSIGFAIMEISKMFIKYTD